MQENSTPAAGRILFSHPRALVFHGRWQDLGLGPKSVDVVLTDPPFPEHVHVSARTNARAAGREGKLDLKFDCLAGYEHVPAFLQIARRWVVLFCALEDFGTHLDAAGGWRERGTSGGYVRSGVWRKTDGMPQRTGDRPAQPAEGFAVMHPPGGKMIWSGHGHHAWWEGKDDVDADFLIKTKVCREANRHRAQKPRELCDRLAGWFVPSWDVPDVSEKVVLDACAGSGALGMSALRLGATVIFCEIDQQWAEFIAGEVKFYLNLYPG